MEDANNKIMCNKQREEERRNYETLVNRQMTQAKQAGVTLRCCLRMCVCVWSCGENELRREIFYYYKTQLDLFSLRRLVECVFFLFNFFFFVYNLFAAAFLMARIAVFLYFFFHFELQHTKFVLEMCWLHQLAYKTVSEMFCGRCSRSRSLSLSTSLQLVLSSLRRLQSIVIDPYPRLSSVRLVMRWRDVEYSMKTALTHECLWFTWVVDVTEHNVRPHVTAGEKKDWAEHTILAPQNSWSARLCNEQWAARNWNRYKSSMFR